MMMENISQKIDNKPKSLKIIATRFWSAIIWLIMSMDIFKLASNKKKIIETRCKWSIDKDNCKTCLAFYIEFDHKYYQIIAPIINKIKWSDRWCAQNRAKRTGADQKCQAYWISIISIYLNDIFVFVVKIWAHMRLS